MPDIKLDEDATREAGVEAAIALDCKIALGHDWQETSEPGDVDRSFVCAICDARGALEKTLI